MVLLFCKTFVSLFDIYLYNTWWLILWIVLLYILNKNLSTKCNTLVSLVKCVLCDAFNSVWVSVDQKLLFEIFSFFFLNSWFLH